jgi:hypothetical protein
MSTSVSTRTETASATSAAWSGNEKKKPPARWRAARLSRRVPYLLLGVILVVACAAAAVVVSTRLGDRQPVLMLARPVSVGQLLSTPDLRRVSMPIDSGFEVIPVTESSTVLGRPVAYSLPAGTLLTRVVLGASAMPPTGQAVVGVGLAAGQFPPGLALGSRVAVLVSATNAPGASGSSIAAPVEQWSATVVDIAASTTDRQTTVVSLVLPDTDARLLGAVQDERVNLLVLNGGER